MATGNYGTKRPADVNPTDVEIFYTFRSNRANSGPTEVFTLSTDNLVPLKDASGRRLGGLYSITLPRDQFSQRGFYTITIRPRRIETTIFDCGVLSAIPSIKGIVLDRTSSVFSEFLSLTNNGSLTGFRVEYIDSTGAKIPNLFRVVTSANIAEQINDNVNSTTQKTVRYRFVETGSLLFLTLSPSTAPSIRPTALPFIGTPGQSIILTNTYFDPLTIEVEITDSTLEAVSAFLFGNEVRRRSQDDLSGGLRTHYFPGTNDIFKQFQVFTIQDEETGAIYDVKQELLQPDLSQDFDQIIEFNNQ